MPAIIRIVYFSATGTTKMLARTFGQALGGSFDEHDLLRQPLEKDISFGPEDLVLVAAPVYSGRVAPIALESIRHLHGSDTPAAILVAYGNRAYDDALLELQDTLERQGFRVTGAGAFVARHAVFPRYAVGRPDNRDLAVLREFAGRIAEKVRKGEHMRAEGLHVPGNRPYRKPVDMTLYPRSGSSCISCGACAAICPARVINPKKPSAKPAKGCLSCAACIHVCPTGARAFGGPVYTLFDVGFYCVFRALFFWKKERRTEPEIFF